MTAGQRLDAKGWAALAMREAGLWMRWATTSDRATALNLEKRVLTALHEHLLWNLGRS